MFDLINVPSVLRLACSRESVYKESTTISLSTYYDTTLKIDFNELDTLQYSTVECTLYMYLATGTRADSVAVLQFSNAINKEYFVDITDVLRQLFPATMDAKPQNREIYFDIDYILDGAEPAQNAMQAVLVMPYRFGPHEAPWNDDNQRIMLPQSLPDEIHLADVEWWNNEYVGVNAYFSHVNRTKSNQNFKSQPQGAYKSVNPYDNVEMAIAPSATSIVAMTSANLAYAVKSINIIRHECGWMEFQWFSDESGGRKTYAFRVISDEVTRPATLDVIRDGSPRHLATTARVVTLQLPNASYATWRYIADLNGSPSVWLNAMFDTPDGTDRANNYCDFKRVKLVTPIPSIRVGDKATLEFSVQLWERGAEWA